ncbi:MAG TPA: hypothetical protein VFQ37_02985, partial [Mycobacterium sp.]|nr:hypothetical protein [Mycobacterium sp.]
MSTTVGTFLAFGITPLTAPPSARAEIDDLFPVDSLTDTVSQAVGGVDPALFGADAPGIDSLAPALGELALPDAGLLGNAAYTWASAIEVILAGLFQAEVYGTIHDLGELWVNSPFGHLFDPLINLPFVALTGRDLIGNGIDGTLAHPDGGPGGWLFGDGGNGYDA